MHIRLLAVGDRQPAWVDQAFDDYKGRLPKQWKFRLQDIATGQRGKGSGQNNAIAAESRKLLAHIRPAERVILLDERGQQHSSIEFSRLLVEWQNAGLDISFIIGGPDGVSEDCRTRADACWSLSRLTLPHGLARVVFAEQLYRAASITQGHPYHRE